MRGDVEGAASAGARMAERTTWRLRDGCDQSQTIQRGVNRICHEPRATRATCPPHRAAQLAPPERACTSTTVDVKLYIMLVGRT